MPSSCKSAVRVPSSLRSRCLRALVLLACAPLSQGCHGQATLTLGPETLRTQVTQLGINLSGQTYYDSGEMLRNLVVRNPGFEGETWQSILHCQTVTATTCTDVNQYAVWPANFLQGATVETVNGLHGLILSSTAAQGQSGVTVTFAGIPAAVNAGDFLIVRIVKPGTPDAGWWPSTSGGATFTAETYDLSPNTTGKQAMLINALAAGASAHLKSYFDSTANHSFVQLTVPYQLHFRAKPVAGTASLNLSLLRLGTSGTLTTFLNQDVPLKPGWNDYALTTQTVDVNNPIGTVELAFNVQGSTIMMDDVSLVPYNVNPVNQTAFRDPVFKALRALHPGFLRYMDNGTSYGSSLDNLLADQFSRQRSGYSTQSTLAEDIPIGMPDFLTLCESIGADPWVTLPAGLNQIDAANLIQYLAGSVTTPYGARRAALGHPIPWTQSFKTIHLELGNEQWNNLSFSGATLNDPVVYATRAALIFGTMRATPGYIPAQFDLVMGTWSAVPWYTGQELGAAKGFADTVSIAPYLFSTFNDASSTEAVFGSMFAEPEQWDSHSGGQVAQQLVAARAATPPVKLAVYEVNLGTNQGGVTQAAVNAAVPSLGGALAVADHMLLMLRDLGITTQALFALPEYVNSFAGGKNVALWGSVVDMGGSSGLRRPTFLATQMINQAILPNLIATHLTNGPTWKQAASQNDSIAAGTMQTLQTFAFADGQKRSLILINLSRTATIPLNFAGANAPTGQVQQCVLTAQKISYNNEQSEQVSTSTSTVSNYPASTNLPPFSMTVLTWTAQ